MQDQLPGFIRTAEALQIKGLAAVNNNNNNIHAKPPDPRVSKFFVTNPKHISFIYCKNKKWKKHASLITFGWTVVSSHLRHLRIHDHAHDCLFILSNYSNCAIYGYWQDSLQQPLLKQTAPCQYSETALFTLWIWATDLGRVWHTEKLVISCPYRKCGRRKKPSVT